MSEEPEPDWLTAERGFRAEADRWALDRTIGIAFQQPDGNPVIDGCGVLLQIADAVFVLSAGHVLKAASDAKVILAAMMPGQTFVDLGATEIRIAPDPADVAIIRLPKENAEALAHHGKRFLNLSEIVRGSTPLPHGRYTVVGHPKETTKADYDARRFAMMPVTHWTGLYPGALANVTPGLSIALDFSEDTRTDPLCAWHSSVASAGVGSGSCTRGSSERVDSTRGKRRGFDSPGSSTAS